MFRIERSFGEDKSKKLPVSIVTFTYSILLFQAQLRANTFLALDQQDDPKVRQTQFLSSFFLSNII